MKEMLTAITEGRGQDDDVERLEALAKTIQDGSLCGLGQTAPNPVLTTLKYFRDEYEAHINNKKCPAGVCKALIKYSIDAEKCTGCGVCLRACPVNAISGEKKQPHKIDEVLCTVCGSCHEVCKFEAIVIE